MNQHSSSADFKTSSARHPHDGPGVFREIADKETLARDPRLTGKLDAPHGAPLHAPPENAVRVMTINIHMAVPDGISLTPFENESIEALRDVALLVNRVDPDIVLVQEIRNGAGLGDVASILAQLIGARDKAFTPALAGDGKKLKFGHYGTGIYTRNGFTIERAVNAALPNEGADTEPRSAGIAAIHAPDGQRKLTVISTHLAHKAEEDRPLRARQLAALAEIAEALRETGGFAYADALAGEKHAARDFPRAAVVLGGDLNQPQPESDAALKPAGFIHAGDAAGRALEATAMGAQGPHRIDHLYASGVRAVIDVFVEPVPQAECKTGKAPTDHKAVISDIRP